MKDVWKTVGMPIFLMIVFVFAIVGVYNMAKGIKNTSSLTLTTPTTISTSESELLVVGKADPKTMVSVNGEAAKVDSKGEFTKTVKLKDGVNKIKVSAQKSLSIFVNEKTITATRTTIAVIPTPTPQPSTSPSPSRSAVPAGQSAADSALATSGPEDSLFGALGITALCLSGYVYLRSRRFSQNLDKKYNYRLFT